MRKVKIWRHTQMKTDKNSYIDYKYFEDRYKIDRSQLSELRSAWAVCDENRKHGSKKGAEEQTPVPIRHVKDALASVMEGLKETIFSRISR